MSVCERCFNVYSLVLHWILTQMSPPPCLPLPLVRYTLNKVTVNGDMPQRVKKDAHSIILDFIRSRPPLKKVGRIRGF